MCTCNVAQFYRPNAMVVISRILPLKHIKCLCWRQLRYTGMDMIDITELLMILSACALNTD